MSLALTPYAFIDEQELREHLNISASTADNTEDRLVAAINRATSWMESRCARPLKARNFRTAYTATTTGTAASGQAVVTVTDTSSIKVGDDVVGSGLDVYSQVLSVNTANGQVTLTRNLASAVGSGTTLTFCRAPLALDIIADIDTGGRRYQWPGPVLGSQELWCPVYPLAAANVYGIYWLDAANNRTQILTSTLRVDEMSGRLLISYDVFPAGALNVQIECRAGYEQPSGTALGHPTEYEDLRAISKRTAEVFYQDMQTMRGRGTSVNAGAFSSSVPNFDMPSDIENALWKYWRRSG